MLATVVALGVVAGPALAVVSTVFPSTNDANRSLGWAHVNQVSVGDGTMTLELVSTRGFAQLLRVPVGRRHVPARRRRRTSTVP